MTASVADRVRVAYDLEQEAVGLREIGDALSIRRARDKEATAARLREDAALEAELDALQHQNVFVTDRARQARRDEILADHPLDVAHGLDAQAARFRRQGGVEAAKRVEAEAQRLRREAATAERSSYARLEEARAYRHRQLAGALALDKAFDGATRDLLAYQADWLEAMGRVTEAREAREALARARAANA